MDTRIPCPNCGQETLDLHNYSSMIVVAPNVALFSLGCAACGTGISCVRPIPKDMLEEIRCAAHEVGAGMGQAS